eukprot:scaffold18778_cov154-Amphora_coffeaeformis.AAC.7
MKVRQEGTHGIMMIGYILISMSDAVNLRLYPRWVECPEAQDDTKEIRQGGTVGGACGRKNFSRSG